MNIVRYNSDMLRKNHPNRKPLGVCPSPEAVKAFRAAQGLTQAECAALVHVTLRAWQFYESGGRKMPAAYWELLQIKFFEGGNFANVDKGRKS